MAKVSIVTAFLNEEGNLSLLRDRLVSVLEKLDMSWEIVLVDDHSEDASSILAHEWVASDARVRYFRLSRTCGSHAAYSAGIARCTGDCVILLAADLQDPPEVIPELLVPWRQGYDVVIASRAERKGESWLSQRLSQAYWWVMRKFAMPTMPPKGADFLLLDRKVIDAYTAIPEKNTSFLAMILWMGFRQTSIDYAKERRHSGRSKWSLSHKIKIFIDSLVSFSYAPIRLMSLAGIFVGLLGSLYAVIVVVNALRGCPIEGWSSLMVVILVLGGFQLSMLGILGEYLWRTFDEVRGRPRYIIEEHVGLDVSQKESRAA